MINVNNGNVHTLTLDIAKAKDGRHILYTTNGKIKKVGNVQVNSLKTRGSGQNSNFHYSLSENDQNVNSKMSLSEDAANTIADSKNIYGKDAALEETVADADEQTVTEQARSDESLPANDSATDTVKREQLERILGSKDSYTSESAGALYEELRNLKKGVRASNRLGCL